MFPLAELAKEHENTNKGNSEKPFVCKPYTTLRARVNHKQVRKYFIKCW